MGRILVADDEEGIRSFVAETLELAGHEVRCAADGREAAALLDRESFDAVVTDLKMPGLDGLGLLRKIRAEQPETEVIVLTAYGTVDTAVAAMKAGAFDYVQKPVGSPAELRLVVERALERRALLALKDRAQRDAPAPVRLTWGDPTMTPVVEALRKVARTQATVLLLGESGTGKEMAARAIHQWSERADGPLVAVSCAALSETLLESELFGHEKGAFTGAHARRRGRLELAEGGTFFLDEVGELALHLQAKLLRVLQERTFERLGGTRTLTANVRWIAATNRDLHQMMADGRFREDLYHRLAVFPVRLPPLRERRQDFLPLAETLLHGIGRELGRAGLRLHPEAARRLVADVWPGNVRALRNVLERAAILADTDEIGVEHLWFEPTAPKNVIPESEISYSAIPDSAPQLRSLADLERDAIERALAEVGGNRKQAADLLGIGLRTLYDKIKRYGLG